MAVVLAALLGAGLALADISEVRAGTFRHLWVKERHGRVHELDLPDWTARECGALAEMLRACIAESRRDAGSPDEIPETLDRLRGQVARSDSTPT